MPETRFYGPSDLALPPDARITDVRLFVGDDDQQMVEITLERDVIDSPGWVMEPGFVEGEDQGYLFFPEKS